MQRIRKVALIWVMAKRGEATGDLERSEGKAGGVAYNPNLRRVSSGSRPSIRSSFTRLVRPVLIWMLGRGSVRSLERNSIKAALALPSTAGARNLMRTSSPISPTIQSFCAPGVTLTFRIESITRNGVTEEWSNGVLEQR